MREFLDYDPLSGITQYIETDEDTGQSVIHSVADSEPILEANKAMANDDTYSKDGIKNSFWHVASIPPIVQMQWLQKGVNIMNRADWPKVKKLLNDPEYRYLKTTWGKI